MKKIGRDQYLVEKRVGDNICFEKKNGRGKKLATKKVGEINCIKKNCQ